jgi:hypothetical protein
MKLTAVLALSIIVLAAQIKSKINKDELGKTMPKKLSHFPMIALIISYKETNANQVSTGL